MRKPLFVAAVVLVVLATALTVSFARTRSITQPTSFRVIEHGVTDVVTDIGKKEDSQGDIFSWYNPVYDDTDTTKVGHDQGDCIRVSTSKGAWECRWLTFLNGRGSIMVEGVFYDAKDSTLAVTGGTGEFDNARGTMALSALSGGRYNFDFQLLP